MNTTNISTTNTSPRWFEHLARWLKDHDRYWEILDRDTNKVYMKRHYVLFKNRPRWFPFNVVLHHVVRSDDPSCGIHNHPWLWWGTLVLAGGYWEEIPANPNFKPGSGSYPEIKKVWRRAGSLRFKRGSLFHKLELDPIKAGSETWTLFFMGPRNEGWGFLDKVGNLIQHEEYIKNKDQYVEAD